jgi:xylulokinase
VDIAGTASVFCSTVAAFQPDTEHRVLGCSRAVASGLWHHFAYINGGGQNLEWFKNNIASGFSTEKMDFDLLNEKANEAGFQEDNPLFIPHLGGRVCPSEPYLRGAWIDLNWSHHIGHLFHAVLEGVALEYGIYLKIIQSFSKDDLIEMRITGGGSSSDLWNQIKADALGLPILKLSREASAPMGAALIAGFGVGLFKDYATTVQDWMRIQQVIEPTPPQYLKYQKRIKRYEKLMKMLNELEN